jgi:hypothetical protein
MINQPLVGNCSSSSGCSRQQHQHWQAGDVADARGSAAKWPLCNIPRIVRDQQALFQFAALPDDAERPAAAVRLCRLHHAESAQQVTFGAAGTPK